MFDLAAGDVGSVMVMTSDNRGFTPEEIADRALDKIMYVGSQTHPAIRDQAEAFRENIREVIVFYMHETIRSHNVTLVSKFKQAGYPELTAILDI
jgi:hypothetical protein